MTLRHGGDQGHTLSPLQTITGERRQGGKRFAYCWVALMLGHSWNVSGALQQRWATERLLASSNLVTLAQPRELLTPSTMQLAI